VFSPHISLPSYAKVNLSLRILGKRPDGYHEIVTVLQSVSLHDQLHLSKRDDTEVVLTSDSRNVPTDETNLIVRAARILADRFELTIGATIHLQKRIPVRAGLGGGSANAAMALLGLSCLWQLDLDRGQLAKLGSELGADVPYFFFGGRAVATGIGTVVKPIDETASVPLLIVTPRAGISTPKAYQALKASALTSPESASILTSSLAEEFLTKPDQWPLHNDFEKVIFENEPETLRVQAALLEAGAQKTLLAGSGSSLFGIFGSVEDQQRAEGQIKAEAGWQVFSCRTISRDEYVRALDPCGTTLLRSS
jgi:4-diphosphocytidyl-2-C-methyl-D-erythritol kinase